MNCRSETGGDGCTTGKPQGVGPEAYLDGTPQGPVSEDAWKDAHILGRSRLFMKHPGLTSIAKKGVKP